MRQQHSLKSDFAFRLRSMVELPLYYSRGFAQTANMFHRVKQPTKEYFKFGSYGARCIAPCIHTQHILLNILWGLSMKNSVHDINRQRNFLTKHQQVWTALGAHMDACTVRNRKAWEMVLPVVGIYIYEHSKCQLWGPVVPFQHCGHSSRLHLRRRRLDCI